MDNAVINQHVASKYRGSYKLSADHRQKLKDKYYEEEREARERLQMADAEYQQGPKYQAYLKRLLLRQCQKYPPCRLFLVIESAHLACQIKCSAFQVKFLPSKIRKNRFLTPNFDFWAMFAFFYELFGYFERILIT